MFESNTVIVVGAGASVEFGLPSGQQIYRDALGFRVEKAQDTEELEVLTYFYHYLVATNQQRVINQVDEFTEKVASSPTNSIDRLAWLNPNISECCRAFSAWSLVKASFEPIQTAGVMFNKRLQPKGARSRSTSHLRPVISGYQNWIGRVADKWLGASETAEALDPARLKFVIFNYDTMIEEGFGQFASGTDRFGVLGQQSLP